MDWSLYKKMLFNTDKKKKTHFGITHKYGNYIFSLSCWKHTRLPYTHTTGECSKCNVRGGLSQARASAPSCCTSLPGKARSYRSDTQQVRLKVEETLKVESWGRSFFIRIFFFLRWGTRPGQLAFCSWAVWAGAFQRCHEGVFGLWEVSISASRVLRRRTAKEQRRSRAVFAHSRIRVGWNPGCGSASSWPTCASHQTLLWALWNIRMMPSQAAGEGQARTHASGVQSYDPLWAEALFFPTWVWSSTYCDEHVV